MAPSKAPTSEIGVGASVGTLTWGNFTDDTERVPELRWPRSVKEYDRMRNDSQIEGLDAGMSLPLMRYRWEIDPNGADAGVVERISEDMGLPVKGSAEEVDDTATNFSHDDHLRHTLLAKLYGHMYMEIVGEVVDGWWRLRKLAPRMPMTLAAIEVDNDGMLAGVRQNISRKPTTVAPLIPVEHLVAFVWKREGANWAGRSILRPLYANWLIKQRLIRVDATKHERTGMGIPIAKATAESVGRRALAIANKMAQAIRGGQNAGGALPYGMDMKLMGVEGNVPDTLASIKYHDEAMARALLMMFIQLGQTETGSRALGSSFIDFFSLALEATAKWYASVMTRVVFRRWVVWNVGESSPTPKLAFVPGPAELATADLKAMLDAGAITTDPELEAWIRGKHGMPVKVIVPGATEPEPVTPPVTARRGRRVYAAEQGSINLPARDLRREPYAHEVTAAVDFAQLDEDFASAVERLVEGWQEIRAGHINQIVDQIAALDADDLEKLAAIEATAGEGASLLTEIMQEVAEAGALGAVQEAKAQGVDATLPDLQEVWDALVKRAAAVDALLTRSISEAGARKATSLAGAALGPDDIANEVRTYLEGLSDAYLEEQFTGSVSQAQNTGRRKVLNEQDPAHIYASELLDTNTCTNCKTIDGNEYDTVAGAELDYPSGGYKDCLGGPRCRGTLVGVYEND